MLMEQSYVGKCNYGQNIDKIRLMGLIVSLTEQTCECLRNMLCKQLANCRLCMWFKVFVNCKHFI